MYVLVDICAALYAGLRLRVAVQAAEHKLDLVLDFVELGIYLKLSKSWLMRQSDDRHIPHPHRQRLPVSGLRAVNIPTSHSCLGGMRMQLTIEPRDQSVSDHG